jgi:hypothetical protein
VRVLEHSLRGIKSHTLGILMGKTRSRLVRVGVNLNRERLGRRQKLDQKRELVACLLKPAQKIRVIATVVDRALRHRMGSKPKFSFRLMGGSQPLKLRHGVGGAPVIVLGH